MTERDDRTPVEYVREEFRLETGDEGSDSAAAVHSMPDEARMHGNVDETETFQGAGGELRQVNDEEELDE